MKKMKKYGTFVYGNWNLDPLQILLKKEEAMKIAGKNKIVVVDPYTGKVWIKK